jgi:hypothetical protein
VLIVLGFERRKKLLQNYLGTDISSVGLRWASYYVFRLNCLIETQPAIKVNDADTRSCSYGAAKRSTEKRLPAVAELVARPTI